MSSIPEDDFKQNTDGACACMSDAESVKTFVYEVNRWQASLRHSTDALFPLRAMAQLIQCHCEARQAAGQRVGKEE